MWAAIRRSSLRSPLRSAVSRRTIKPLQFGQQLRWLSTDEYHNIADDTLESITISYENLIEKQPDVDIDLSQGVLTLTMPVGTYVINKQPPNHQIWLSSPISGPKRFEWDEKEHKWVYQREYITLGSLLKQETKDTLQLDLDLEVD